MRTESLEPHEHRVFLARAEEFFQAMNILLDLEERPHAAALLGIHAVIAMNDSINVSVLGKRCRSDQHSDASQLLQESCHQRHLSKHNGLKYFNTVISLKSDIAYGKRFSAKQHSDVNKVLDRTTKFFSWAYQNFDTLKAEGIDTDETNT